MHMKAHIHTRTHAPTELRQSSKNHPVQTSIHFADEEAEVQGVNA